MRFAIYIALMFMGLGALSWVSAGSDTNTIDWFAGGVTQHTSDGEHGISYHVYTPSSFDPTNPPPMLLLFSPGGKGAGILQKFKESAETAGWIAVGCDTLRNNMKIGDVEDDMEDEFLNEVYAKIPHNKNRIYLGGFSGGGWRAFHISHRRSEGLAGIISCGGWLGGYDQADKPYCKNMAVAIVNGDRDERASKWVPHDKAVLEKRECRVKTFSFEGAHHPPPSETIDEVLKWFEREWKN